MPPRSDFNLGNLTLVGSTGAPPAAGLPVGFHQTAQQGVTSESWCQYNVSGGYTSSGGYSVRGVQVGGVGGTYTASGFQLTGGSRIEVNTIGVGGTSELMQLAMSTISPGTTITFPAANLGDVTISNLSNLIEINLDPKIQGTSVPVYRISALRDGGMTVEEIAEDFPSLTKEKIVEALEYAEMFPPAFGNPYPTESIKRLLRNSGFRHIKKSVGKSTGRLGKGESRRVYSRPKRSKRNRRQQKRHERPEVVQWA